MGRNIYRDVLLGVAVGDALGVPVEFKDRKYLERFPVIEMMGYGSHNQPIGTWSDDTSLTLCLADVLVNDGYDVRKIAKSFYNWLHENLWTAHGNVFDIGNGTFHAIERYTSCKSIEDYSKCGGDSVTDNGNGSLMRILPLLFEIRHLSIEEKFNKVKEISSLTHGHNISILCCFYYLEFAKGIIDGLSLEEALSDIQNIMKNRSYEKGEAEEFLLLMSKHFALSHEAEIYSSGYVIHSLEASIWCLMNTNSYKEAVLKAVNLGDDTDTTAAITGGLAALYYGYETIPQEWLDVLVRKDDIIDLADKLKAKYEN